MIEKGIMKGAERKEKGWEKAKKALREPFKKELDRFREVVKDRKDFDPTSLFQFGLFMAKGIINILKEVEQKLGEIGQKVVNEALIRTGYEVGSQMIDPESVPSDLSGIELMSFLATIINTQAWTSIEDPRINSKKKCSFNILWCPLQDLYSAFDCRVQRYLVQGIVDYFRETVFKDRDYQIYFESTIPAGADCCRFIIEEKEPGDKDKWETYSEKLENKAIKKMNK